MWNKISISGVVCTLHPTRVQLKGCDFIRYNEIAEFCDKLKQKTGDFFVRSAFSWSSEFVTKKFFYNLRRKRPTGMEFYDFEEPYKLFFFWLVYSIYLLGAAVGKMNLRLFCKQHRK